MQERRRVLVVTSVALFFSVLVWFNYSAVLPLIVEEWGLSGTEAGVVFGALQAGYLVAIVPAGWLADHYSPRWVIAVGATGTALPSLAFAAVADGVLVGTVLRFLSGLFVAGVYRDTARVPRGLTPKVNRVSYMMGTTVLESTVATWIKDLNPKQLPAVARNATPLKTRVFGVMRRELPGRGGAADPHGRTERSGINSRRLVTGSPRGIKLACDRTARFGTCGQNGEAAGLAPAVLHSWHNWELFGVRNWLLAFLVMTPAFVATDSAVVPGLVVGAMIHSVSAYPRLQACLLPRCSRCSKQAF